MLNEHIRITCSLPMGIFWRSFFTDWHELGCVCKISLMKDLFASALAYTPPPAPIIYTQHSKPRDLFKNMSDYVTRLLETLQGLPSNWELRPKSTGWLLRPHVIPLPVSSPTSSPTTVSSGHSTPVLQPPCRSSDRPDMLQLTGLALLTPLSGKLSPR